MRAVTTQSTNDQPEVLLNCLASSACYSPLCHAMSFHFRPFSFLQGRRWSDGLHQAVEAKEALPINNESITLASISYQNFFLQVDVQSCLHTGSHACMQAGRSTKAHSFLWPPFPCTAEVEKALNDYPSAMKASRCPPSYTRGSSCRRHTHACLRACTHPRKHTAFLASLLYHFWLLSTLKCY